MMSYLLRLKGKTKVKEIEEKNKKVIFLDEGDVLEVKTLFKNRVNIHIECKNNALYVEDILEQRIQQIKLEQEQLEKLKKNK